MRLGGPVKSTYESPGEWIESLRSCNYRAAFCPVTPETPESEIEDYYQAAKKSDVVISEVAAWSNPVSKDDETRKKAREKCKERLWLADRIEARCCVNVAGSRGNKWDGPCDEDLTEETFEMIVETVREIIDSVKPTRSFYTLETMPWMYPDSVDSYVRLIQAIDRKAFGVHMDPVNLISSPQRYFNNAAVIRECFDKLGRHIRSCHCKDILLRDKLTVHLDEVRPGLGGLDYRTFLHEANKLGDDIPVMLEHLPNVEEYETAAAYIRSVAQEEKIAL